MKTVLQARLLAFILAAASLAGGGCANADLSRVKPWQRGALADPVMQPGGDPLSSALADHVYFAREAATGGRSVGGSGCGCN